jgi:hypothetical protein
MRRLTAHERVVLREVGDPGEPGPPDAVFAECVRQEWGYWGPECWHVTERGKRALAIDVALEVKP